MKKGLERHDRIMIRTLITVIPIIILIAVLWKEWAFEPKDIECWKVIQRETQNVDLRGDTTRGILQMTGWRKSFSLNGYAVDGDTICKDWEWWVKKDTFISY